MYKIFVIFCLLLSGPSLASQEYLDLPVKFQQNLPRPHAICQEDELPEEYKYSFRHIEPSRSYQNTAPVLIYPSPTRPSDPLPLLENEEDATASVFMDQDIKIVIYASREQMHPDFRSPPARPCLRRTLYGSCAVLISGAIGGLIYWLVH